MNEAVQVKKIPTKLHVKCPQCLHQATVQCFINTYRLDCDVQNAVAATRSFPAAIVCADGRTGGAAGERRKIIYLLTFDARAAKGLRGSAVTSLL
jgi:hypothetical protein